MMQLGERLAHQKNQKVYYSFDVFDTAITRALLSPDHLHWIVARLLSRNKFDMVQPDLWRRYRVEAERLARANPGQEEISLSDIYSHLAHLTALDQNILDAALATEIEVEAALCFPVEAIKKEVNGLKDAPFFISDMYLPGAIILRMLEKCGYRIDPSRFYLSSDVNSSKRTGNMYRFFAQRSHAEFSSMAHVGDHVDSDVRIPRSLGISARLFDDVKANPYESALSSPTQHPWLSSIIAGSARVSRLSAVPLGDRESGIIKVSAGVAGPLVTGFVLWALHQALALGARDLWFLARDGQVMTTIADNIISAYRLDVKAHYLLASRKSLFLPSLMGHDDRFKLIAEDAAGGSLKDLLRRFDIPASARDPESDLGDVVERSPTYQAKLIAFLTSRGVLIDSKIAEEAHAMEAYLEREGFFADQERAIIVDVGWKGNLQLRMQRAIKTMAGGGSMRIFGLYFGLVEIPKSITTSVRTYANISPPGELIESFCMADHLSLGSYQELLQNRGGDVNLGPDKAAVDWGVQLQQRIMARFAEVLMTGLAITPPGLEDLVATVRAGSLQALRSFVASPGFEESEAYGGIQHAADTSHTNYQAVAPRLSFLSSARMFLPRRLRGNHGLSIWPEGSLARRFGRGRWGKLIMAGFQRRMKRPRYDA